MQIQNDRPKVWVDGSRGHADSLPRDPDGAAQPYWLFAIDIQALLHRVPGHGSLAAALSKLLQMKTPAQWVNSGCEEYDGELHEIVRLLDDFADAHAHAGVRDSEKTLRLLRASLDSLYDWADKKRVWLGSPRQLAAQFETPLDPKISNHQ